MRAPVAFVASLFVILLVNPIHAKSIFTYNLTTVATVRPGFYSYSVGGWDGGGIVTGAFIGTDKNEDGKLSTFDSEVRQFTMSYTGGLLVPHFSLRLGHLVDLVYVLDNGPLGDAPTNDFEGIFAVGPGGWFIAGWQLLVDVQQGRPYGAIFGDFLLAPEPNALALVALGFLVLGALRCTNGAFAYSHRLGPIHFPNLTLVKSARKRRFDRSKSNAIFRFFVYSKLALYARLIV